MLWLFSVYFSFNLGILRWSILKIDLVIRLKGGWKQFLGKNRAWKSQNCSKSISRKSLVVESWLTPQNDHRTWLTMVVLKIQFFVFWGVIMAKLYDFPYLVNRRLCKVDWPSKQPQEWIYYGCSKIYPSDNRKCLFLQKCFSKIFLGLSKWNFKNFHITRTIYQIKLADISKWPKDPSFY